MTDYFIYRWRYVVGYSLLGITLITLLLMVALYVPGGISDKEMESAVKSSSLSFSNFNPAMVIDLPYHILQRISFKIFGITPLSIKLPSILIGLATIVGLIILLRTWFKDNVAILTTILVVSTSQFLLITQNGTPSIIYVFWSIWILVAAMMVSRGSTFASLWKIALFGLASLSLYTPLSLYMLLAIGSAVVLHPHLRYIIRRLPKYKLLLAATCALIILTPLGYALSRQPTLIWTLLGFSNLPMNLGSNLGLLFNQYFNFMAPLSSSLITPVYGLATVLIVLLGMIRLFTTKYTARSYIISIWFILILPILILNPSTQNLTFVPVTLMVAMGITLLFRRWYRLFPFNPYARVAGLLPLFILIASMTFSGVDRFTYGYRYDQNAATSYKKDLSLINSYLDSNSKQKVFMLVSPTETAFYTALAAYRSNFSLVSQTSLLPADSVVVATNSANRNLTNLGLANILTSPFSQQSDRFYIYKNAKK